MRRDIGPIAPSAALGIVMVSLYAAVSVGLGIVAWHLTRGRERIEVWFERGVVSDADLAWANTFDDETAKMYIVIAVVTALAALATAFWSRRIAQNTVSIGNTTVSPGWTTVCWFIPLVWFWAGFSQLRRAPRAEWAVWSWQVAFVAPSIGSWIATRLGRLREARDELSPNGLQLETVRQGVKDDWIVGLMFAGCAALATILTARTVVLLARTFREISVAAAQA